MNTQTFKTVRIVQAIAQKYIKLADGDREKAKHMERSDFEHFQSTDEKTH